MAQSASITLIGRQRDESGEETVTTCRADADYYEKDGNRFILYKEVQEDSGLVIKNIIKYKDSVLEMTKRGGIRSRMIFETGRTHRTDYVTPYGTLPLEIATRKADFVSKEGRIEIRLDYALSFGGQSPSDCVLELCLQFL